ncbi:enoyl-CoA hydratase/isomerase [bacterium]|jgi:2-(1,2-epoxy-1,2-dihydrophenyl)acetyl-CoA isomerase|nr:enoyl-CoA hydratase/isomerase [Gammaproteobacteria bacterium]MDC0559339.1 enoyl-CoA hydratase/isomerase [bacterium]
MERMQLDFVGSVAVLKFNHPQVMNAVGAQMLADLAESILQIKDPSNGARCLLLTGQGRGFCAGANLQDDVNTDKRNGAGASLRGAYHPLLFELRGLDMPMVTAVNGAAAGVGMSFAMMGDIVCAAKSAYFLQAFAKIGLIPDGGSTFMLPRLVGWGRAMELSLLAERLSAEKAMEWGLVNRLYEDQDDLMAGALQIAQKLANGPRSLSLIRKAYWQTWQNSFEQQLELEAQLQNEAGKSKDFAEGVQAFLQKRDAQFKGS